MPKIDRNATLRAFDAAWSKAREDNSVQGSKVSFEELKGAMETMKKGGLSRREAFHAASTIASDPVLTAPAAKEAFALLKSIGETKLDKASVEAMKAEFSLRATAPFKTLSVPGRLVKNSVDMPEAVSKAATQVNEPEAEAEWETVDVRKATLAGQTVFIVHYKDLSDGNGDAEKVKLFSANGKRVAQGSVFDGMAGFAWGS